MEQGQVKSCNLPGNCHSGEVPAVETCTNDPIKLREGILPVLIQNLGLGLGLGQGLGQGQGQELGQGQCQVRGLGEGQGCDD